MKRSEINAAIDAGRRVLEKIHFKLPDFESWTLDEWKRMRPQIDEIVKTGMGWDVTDFGSNDFVNIGATIFTIRNGYAYDSTVGVPYAEKIIIMTEGQTIPLHFHFKKTEDIINGETACCASSCTTPCPTSLWTRTVDRASSATAGGGSSPRGISWSCFRGTASP
jgi:D-lyxose ketol-isomerase